MLIEAGPARAGGLCRRSLGLCAALARKHRRRSDAGTGRHRMHRRWRRVWRPRAATPKPSSGRPACAPRPPPNGSARRPTAPAACRCCPTSPCPAIPIFSPSAIPLPSPAPMASRCPASRRRPSSRDVMSPTPSRRGCAATRRAPFRYKHAGSLAQIGKRKAVIDFGRIKLRGTIAWWIWGIAHIYFLIGLRNRLSVAHQLAVDPRPRSARRAPDHAGQQQGGAIECGHVRGWQHDRL